MQERLVRETFVKLLKRFVGVFHGPAAYRLGRALYKQARGDHPNDMATNGEVFVQECVANAWKQGRLGDQKLVVFDVGANVGDWSATMLQMLPDREYRSEEHTSELQSLMRNSYAVFCLKKKTKN